jgi:hypothetical protein
LSRNARIDNLKNVAHDMFAVNDRLRLFSDLSPVVNLTQQYIFVLLLVSVKERMNERMKFVTECKNREP